MNLFNKSKTIDIIYFCHHTHKHNKLSRESTNLKRLVSSCNEGLNIIGGQYYSNGSQNFLHIVGGSRIEADSFWFDIFLLNRNLNLLL